MNSLKRADKGNENCPVCKKAQSAQYLPFCSKRCADVDLHHWLQGTYAIEAVEDDSESVEDYGNFTGE